MVKNEPLSLKYKYEYQLHPYLNRFQTNKQTSTQTNRYAILERLWPNCVLFTKKASKWAVASGRHSQCQKSSHSERFCQFSTFCFVQELFMKIMHSVRIWRFVIASSLQVLSSGPKNRFFSQRLNVLAMSAYCSDHDELSLVRHSECSDGPSQWVQLSPITVNAMTFDHCEHSVNWCPITLGAVIANQW